MSVRLKAIGVLILLTVLGVGPMPLTSLLGIYIVIARPPWFKELVLRIYEETNL